MRRSPRALAIALTACVAAAIAAPAAASAAVWRQFTPDMHTNLTRVQSLRDGAGLHVVWAGYQSGGSGPAAVFERDVLPSGAYGPARMIAGPLASALAPGIARNPVDGTVWVFSASAGDLTGKLFALSTTNGFATVSGPTAIGTNEYAYSADNAAAAFASDGTAWQVFGAYSKTGVGVDLNEDDMKNAPGIDSGMGSLCCVYDTNVVVDAVTKEAVAGWYSNVDPARAGLEAISLTSKALTYVPASASADRHDAIAPDGPVAMAARTVGGVYFGYCTGYPTCARVLVWKYGTAAPTLVAIASGAKHVQVSAAPGGKLWVSWVRDGQVYATRSNGALTKWGELVHVALPGGSGTTAYRMWADGSLGALDAFAHLDYKGQLATWHVQLQPGLTVTPAALRPLHGKVEKFVVTDAGVPVAGAKVKFGGKTVKTNKKGVAVLKVPAKAGKAIAMATAAGYVSDTALVRVR
jgi:hypothetical protein